MQCLELQKSNSELREPTFFIMGSKHACPFPQRETLSLHSRVTCYTFLKCSPDTGQSVLSS